MDTDPTIGGQPTTGAAVRRSGLRVVRSIWWVSVVVAGIWLFGTRFSQVRDATEGARPALVLASFVLLLGQLWPSSLLWSAAIGRLAPATSVSPRDVFASAAASLPARYLPGSVWYAATRGTLLARRHGVPAAALATTAVLELLLTLAAAIVLGSMLLVAGGRQVLDVGLLSVAGVTAALCASPPVVNRVLAVASRRQGTAVTSIAWSDLGALTGWVLAHWAWASASFVLYLRAFPALADAPVGVLAGAYLVSWAVGFLAVLAPQGAGVFEVALAALLASAAATGVATPTAALVIAGHRALVVVRDLVLASPAILARRRERSTTG